MLAAELHTAAVVAVFATVYLGMFLGGLPGLRLDRCGVALLGAIAVIAITGETVETAARAVDLPTIVLLFAFMVVSALSVIGWRLPSLARAQRRAGGRSVQLPCATSAAMPMLSPSVGWG